MASTELLLIRHGQSEANVGRSDDPDCPLTETGRHQARDVGRWLAESVDLKDWTTLCSPYRRAGQTAAEITAAAGCPFATCEAVREWGKAATVGGRQYALEPIGEVVDRLRAFLAEHRGRKLLVVSHAASIALLTQLAWGETPTTTGEFWLGVQNCRPRWLTVTARQ